MYATSVQELIDELGRLPGVGPKSAQRIAYHLLKLSADDALRLARAISVVKERVSWCRRCFNIAESADPADPKERDQAELAWAERLSEDPAFGRWESSGSASSDDIVARTQEAPVASLECGICRDERRDHTVICVVEEPRDIVAFERTREFRGRYHVLQGAISPIDGVGPEQLRIRELLGRLEPEGIVEIILCTNPNIEGDATALYLASLLKELPVRVTRIAFGLPVGGDLEYADEVTLGRALEGRRELKG